MVFGSKLKPKAVKNDDDDDDDDDDFIGQAHNASELIGHNSSALSLDGRSLIVPDYGDVDDMSSLGTYKYNYHGDGGSTVGYIGDMKIIGKAGGGDTDQSMASALKNQTSSRYESDPALQYGDYDLQTYGASLQSGAERKEVNLSKSNDEEKKKEEEKAEKSGCLPQWITEAPLWLKLIIISSTALLLGAVVLIAVGAKLSIENQISSSSSPQDQNPSSTSSPSPNDVTFQTEVPADSVAGPGPENATVYPDQPVVTITSNPIISPSFAPTKVVLSPSNSPIETISAPVAEVPTTASLSSPLTAAPAVAPTVTPSQSSTLSTVNFFVMGGRFDGEDIATLTDGLQSLPNMDGNTVLFHLGDWNSPYATSCVESSFITNVDIYQQSSIPVYFVPGDNEYNDCPNPTQALGFWHQYLLDFETKYWPEPSWDIMRQSPDYSENFSFLQKEVLFVGINLVGGIIHDQEEWNARHDADLLWIDTAAAKYDGNYTTMVVLAHADPDIEINAYFFRGFYSMVESYDEQVVFVHRNLGVDTWNKEIGFNGIPNLDVVAVEGSTWPPMWIQIDSASGNYTVDQSSWYDNYKANGSLAPSP